MVDSKKTTGESNKKRHQRNKKLYFWHINLQLFIATFLVLCGILLLFSGFWVAPTGEIHNSVLIAFGEACTFAGGLFGIDYTYKYKKYRDRDAPTKKDEEL